MTGPSDSGHRHSKARAVAGKMAIGIGVLVGVVVVASVIFLAWAIAKGEEQSHDWADQVSLAYRSATPGMSEAVVRDELGEPSLVAAETIRGRDARCSVYRVLFSSRELVPYRFCFVHGRLVSKSRNWDDIPND